MSAQPGRSSVDVARRTARPVKGSGAAVGRPPIRMADSRAPVRPRHLAARPSPVAGGRTASSGAGSGSQPILRFAAPVAPVEAPPADPVVRTIKPAAIVVVANRTAALNGSGRGIGAPAVAPCIRQPINRSGIRRRLEGRSNRAGGELRRDKTRKRKVSIEAHIRTPKADARRGAPAGRAIRGSATLSLFPTVRLNCDAQGPAASREMKSVA